MTDTTQAAPAVKYQHPATGWYADILKAWSTRESGPKVTAHLLALAHLLSEKRPGVENLHIAMALRDGGCTVRQFQIAGSCGPANNYRRSLIEAGLVKCAVVGKPYAYCLTVTPKGQKAVDRAAEALAKAQAADAAKPKAAKRKPRAKVTPAAPAPVAEPAPAPADAPQGEPVTA